jgi:hypothetical protein
MPASSGGAADPERRETGLWSRPKLTDRDHPRPGCPAESIGSAPAMAGSAGGVGAVPVCAGRRAGGAACGDVRVARLARAVVPRPAGLGGIRDVRCLRLRLRRRLAVTVTLAAAERAGTAADRRGGVRCRYRSEPGSRMGRHPRGCGVGRTGGCLVRPFSLAAAGPMFPVFAVAACASIPTSASDVGPEVAVAAVTAAVGVGLACSTTGWP